MPPTKQLDRGTSPDQKGIPYESPSIGSETKIREILSKPVAAESTTRRDQLSALFLGVSMNEAARLYSKLSNTRDRDYVLMAQTLHPSTIPKLLEILQVRSGRQTANPIPERLTTDALKNEFLSVTDPPGRPAQPRTTVAQSYKEERGSELFAELARRGEAFSRPDPGTQHNMDLALTLDQATQRFNYTGIDLSYVTSMFSRSPVRLLGGGADGYYRILEQSNDALYVVSDGRIKDLFPQITSVQQPETIGSYWADEKRRVIVVRFPTEAHLKSGDTKSHVFEVWWFAESEAAYNYLAGFAEQMAAFEHANLSPDKRLALAGPIEMSNSWGQGVLMRPLLGDEPIFAQMKREEIRAIIGGVTHLGADIASQKLQNRLQGRIGGGGGGADDEPPVASQPGTFRALSGASPAKVAEAVQNAGVYKIYQRSLRTGPDAEQAASDLHDLSTAIGEHATKTPQGTWKLAPQVSDAVWALPENLRGVLIENVLGETQYKGWFHAGQLNRGYFPDIDFAITTPGRGPQLRASVKTVNTFAKGYEQQVTETLPAHVETIVTSTRNDIAAGRRPAVTTIDIRLPKGSAVPRADLMSTLRDLVPGELKKYVKIQVNEF